MIQTSGQKLTQSEMYQSLGLVMTVNCVKHERLF